MQHVAHKYTSCYSQEPEVLRMQHVAHKYTSCYSQEPEVLRMQHVAHKYTSCYSQEPEVLRMQHVAHKYTSCYSQELDSLQLTHKPFAADSVQYYSHPTQSISYVHNSVIYKGTYKDIDIHEQSRTPFPKKYYHERE